MWEPCDCNGGCFVCHETNLCDSSANQWNQFRCTDRLARWCWSKALVRSREKHSIVCIWNCPPTHIRHVDWLLSKFDILLYRYMWRMSYLMRNELSINTSCVVRTLSDSIRWYNKTSWQTVAKRIWLLTRGSWTDRKPSHVERPRYQRKVNSVENGWTVGRISQTVFS